MIVDIQVRFLLGDPIIIANADEENDDEKMLMFELLDQFRSTVDHKVYDRRATFLLYDPSQPQPRPFVVFSTIEVHQPKRHLR